MVLPQEQQFGDTGVIAGRQANKHKLAHAESGWAPLAPVLESPVERAVSAASSGVAHERHTQLDAKVATKLWHAHTDAPA